MAIQGESGGADGAIARAAASGISAGARVRELRGCGVRELSSLLARGGPVRAEQLAGFAFRGTSLGLPALLEKLSWVTFQKAFVRDGERVRGWNVRVEQRGLGAPSKPLLRKGAPFTFGHFLVEEAAAGRALVLDYGAYARPLDPLRTLRDPLVALDEEAGLILGRTLIKLGPLLLPTPSFFALEREAPLEGDPPVPPRKAR